MNIKNVFEVALACASAEAKTVCCQNEPVVQLTIFASPRIMKSKKLNENLEFPN
jgi:hypothetical protein